MATHFIYLHVRNTNLHSDIFTNMLWAWCWEAATTTNGKLYGGLFAVFITLFLIIRSFNTSRKLNPLPPGPSGLPIVGYLPFLGTHLHRSFADLAKIHGPIFKLKLGKKFSVVIASPSLAREVVRDHDVTFANRDPTIAALVATFGGLDVAFSSYGPYWRKVRMLFVREMMNTSNINASEYLRKQEIHRSIQKVCNEIGTPIDVGNLAFQTVINSMLSMLIGGTLQGEKAIHVGAEFQKVARELMILLGQPNFSDYFPVLGRFDLQGIERRVKKVVRCCEEIIDSAIEQRKVAAGEDMDGKNELRKDFLQVLLELQMQEDEETKLSSTELKALLMIMACFVTDSGTVKTYKISVIEKVPFGAFLNNSTPIHARQSKSDYEYSKIEKFFCDPDNVHDK